MALMRANVNDELWKNAFKAVEVQFEIDKLLPEQEESLRLFIEKGNIFINLPTGYGKSLIFQCLPIVWDVVFKKPRGSSVVVVVSPLKALMADQVEKLGNIGIPAVSLTGKEDHETIQQVMNGSYLLVYCSPECLLTTMRGIFADCEFQSKLIAVAVDEAHCVTQWGFANKESKSAFRKWYGCLGELHSLVPSRCKLIVLTATATKSTKQQILEALHLIPSSVSCVEQSPDKANIFFSREYMDKNKSLEIQFGHLIGELREKNAETPRTIIYCQTRKQCAVLFRLFEVNLKEKIFHGESKPRNRIVEMYHAGSPKSVKEHITSNIGIPNGHIRVLISTIAFGMGVDCKSVRRIVHFGPPKSIEAYIQECGRAGRDGEPSVVVLFYNGLTSVFCDQDMKNFLHTEGRCLRKHLMDHFGVKPKNTLQELHNCCSACQSNCNCGNCTLVWSPKNNISLNQDLVSSQPERKVSSTQRKMVQQQLIDIYNDTVSKANVENSVTCPNIIFEFNGFHIKQVVDNCQFLFTIQDIVRYVEIWRIKYAIEVLHVLNSVFGDIDVELKVDVSVDVNHSMLSDWSQIRDDSTLMELLDSQDLEGIECLTSDTSS